MQPTQAGCTITLHALVQNVGHKSATQVKVKVCLPLLRGQSAVTTSQLGYKQTSRLYLIMVTFNSGLNILVRNFLKQSNFHPQLGLDGHYEMFLSIHYYWSVV